MDKYLDETLNSMDYKTFLNVIYQIPSCIFLKDTQSRYVFLTKRWEQLNQEDVIGKTDVEIRRDHENALLAMEADKNIIRTGNGCKYIIKSDIEGERLTYLELIKEPIFDEHGNVKGIVGLINDVTEKIMFEQRLKEISSTDSLTQLYSRNAGVEMIEKLLEEQCQNRAFMLMDLNKFKQINDRYGHQIGDIVLKEFAFAVKQSLYKNDIAMRLGGDEFIVFLSNVNDEKQIERYIAKFRKKLKAINIEGFDDKITVSIGVTLVDNNNTFDRLYAKTDKLMYEAKQSGALYIIG